MKEKLCKKILGFLLASLLLLTVSPPAFADMGPKPSVTLRLYIYNDQNYAVTLLGNTESTGPWSAPSAYGDWMGSREVWEAFQAYDAPEGTTSSATSRNTSATPNRPSPGVLPAPEILCAPL